MTEAKLRSAERKVSTGISGFDYILGGGFPANHLYLVEGNPGTGKTTLARISHRLLAKGRPSWHN